MNNFYLKECRKSIAEGIVLLENDGTLPLKNNDKVALFGRGQFEYVASGSGSAGRVRCSKITNIGEELPKYVSIDKEVQNYFKTYIENNPFDTNNGWNFPSSQKQPFLEEDFVKDASKRNEKAIFVICRICGESYDCKEEKGNWYLSDAEEQSIACISKYFKNFAVLINSGNLIDMSWVKKYNVGSVAYIWQGGEQGATGTVDALIGVNPPSGKLVDTIAKDIKDYPSYDCFGDEVRNFCKEDIYVGYRYFETFALDKVLYPFGYGLTYTNFTQTVSSERKSFNHVTFTVCVKNVGEYAGKEVVQIYFSAPNGKLGKPKRELIAYKKTCTLEPNESQVLYFDIDIENMASYDDGKGDNPYCYVLEGGVYELYFGNNVRDAKKFFDFMIENDIVVKKLSQALAPVLDFERMTRDINDKLVFEPVPKAKYDIDKRIEENLPKAILNNSKQEYYFEDLLSKKITTEEFVSQFSGEELCSMVKGEGMGSPKALYPGTASCFGGVSKYFAKKNVPVVTTCDGPSGLRLECSLINTGIPSGTLIACAWDTSVFENAFKCVCEEMKDRGVDVLLAPDLNIHRNVLGGRNFEYFSEDPYICGQIGLTIAKFLKEKGVDCCIKHYVANSQELNRESEDECASERCLREIYLKPFEMAVKSNYVNAIMTSYNRVNGISACGNYDLNTTILRKEWGYKGIVMTDWWAMVDNIKNHTFAKENRASMVKAQNDLYMVVSSADMDEDDLVSSYQNGYLTLGELQRSAVNIINFILNSYASVHNIIYKEETTSNLNCVFESNFENDTIKVDLPKDGLYYAEITYKVDDNELKQFTERIVVDGCAESVILVINGTANKEVRKSFRIYLKKDSVLGKIGEAKISNIKIFA